MSKAMWWIGVVAVVTTLASLPAVIGADDNQAVLEQAMQGSETAPEAAPAVKVDGLELPGAPRALTELAARDESLDADNKAVMSKEDIAKGEELDKWFAEQEKKAQAYAKSGARGDIPWPNAENLLDTGKLTDEGSRALGDEGVGLTYKEAIEKGVAKEDGSRWLGCCCCHHVYGPRYWRWRAWRVYRIYRVQTVSYYPRWYCCCC